MALFGSTSTFGQASMFSNNPQANHNPMKDVEVTSPPDDSVSALAFSPATLQSTFLVASSWDNNVCQHCLLTCITLFIIVQMLMIFRYLKIWFPISDSKLWLTFIKFF